MVPDPNQPLGTASMNRLTWTPLHETDGSHRWLTAAAAGASSSAGRGNITGNGTVTGAGINTGPGSVAETGTTIVALVAENAVVMAADRRASIGGGRFVTGKRMRKIEPVHPSAAAAISGVVGHAQQFVRTLDSEARLYADRRGSPPSMTALSTLAGGILRSAPLAVSPLLGGVDEDGAHVFDVDGGGGVLSDTYAAGGSGMQLAYGVLEREYEAEGSVDEARDVAARAIESASERDTASGNGLTVATVSDEGVTVDAYDDAVEVH